MKKSMEPIVPNIKYHDSEIYQDFGVSQQISVRILGDKNTGRTTYLSNFLKVILDDSDDIEFFLVTY